uniref:Uncharacterized protein n=1 Tax=Rhizophora mucronata TaxID=61149 RepID=A0A2P2PPA3_RHIMU
MTLLSLFMVAYFACSPQTKLSVGVLQHLYHLP